MSEVKLCNEMIDRLRAENQEYEMTIVEQDRELAQLKELLNQKRPFNQELEQISRENDLLSSQLAESNSIIGKLHDQIKDLKAYTQVSRNETRRDAELLMQSHELDGMRYEHSTLMQKYSDALTLLKEKEV